MTQERSEDYSFGFVAGHLALDFVNTVSSYRTPNPHYHIANYADLVAWGVQARLLDEGEARHLLVRGAERPAEAARLAKRANDLRGAIHAIFEATSAGAAPKQSDVDVLNTVLSRAMAHSRIERDGSEFKWGWSGLARELDGVLWPVARSAADLLTSDLKSRVSSCASDTCGWVFLDMTRNHSRHWCDMKECGNRAKARRHYHRRRESDAE